MLVIGLTGSFGSGKSTVAAMFSKLGAKVIDADRIARQSIAPSGQCYKKVIRAFGKEIVSRGKIDRARVAQIVFSSVAKRKKLESIIHPYVLRGIKSQISTLKKRKQKIAVVDVPLLFESGLYKTMDVNVVVKANKTIQIARAIKHRKMTKAHVLQRINAQWSINKKIRLADFVIDNRHSLIHTRRQVKCLMNQLLIR